MLLKSKHLLLLATALVTGCGQAPTHAKAAPQKATVASPAKAASGALIIEISAKANRAA